MNELTVNKLHEMLSEMKDAGLGDTFVVTSLHSGAPMPISELLCAPIGTLERWGDFIMSEEDAKSAPDDTPRVIVISPPQMAPCGWLSRELSEQAKAAANVESKLG